MIAAYQYDGPVRDAVHALKYDGLRAVAPVLGARMAALPSVSRLEADVMVPVPLHPSRMRSRGYNHAELLAREIGRRTALPVDVRALRRIRNTPAQARAANEKERARQVAGAFAARGDRVAGKRVLVVDDVATTCSTLDSCARALKTAGAARVIGLVLAREL
jgi:ComF family protein